MSVPKLRLNLYGVRVHCLFEHPALRIQAREALLPFLDCSAPADHLIEAGKKSLRIDGVTVRGLSPTHPFFLEGFLSRVSALFWREAREHLIIHAGAVRKGDHLLLIPGFSGSGKSTLVAWHLARGWEYLGDDLVCLSFQEKRVCPCPLPLKLANPPHPLITAVESIPHMFLSKSWYRKKLRYLVRPAQDIPAASTAETSIELVFPVFFWGAEFSFSPLTRQETFRALVPHCLNFSNHPGESFDALTWLVDRASGHMLFCGDFNQLEERLPARGGSEQCHRSA